MCLCVLWFNTGGETCGLSGGIPCVLWGYQCVARCGICGFRFHACGGLIGEFR